MLRGNLYGLVIALLSFVIALILTVQQVKESGVRVELIIQPVTPASQPQDRLDDGRQEVTANTHK